MSGEWGCVTGDTKSGADTNARFSAVPSWRLVELQIPQSLLLG
jgi:hypothetical protein